MQVGNGKWHAEQRGEEAGCEEVFDFYVAVGCWLGAGASSAGCGIIKRVLMIENDTLVIIEN